MIEPMMPADEAERISSLHATGLLDTAAEERFDRITRLAALVFDVPIAAISLVDTDRQWFKSRVGLTVDSTARSISFCGHAILGAGPMIVNDAHEDARFRDNPLVTDVPHIRFYAGVPVTDGSGHNLGTVCVIDRAPRSFSRRELAILREFGSWAEDEASSMGVDRALEERAEALDALMLARELAESRQSLENLVAHLPGCVFRCEVTPPYYQQHVSDQIVGLTGFPASEFLDGTRTLGQLIAPGDRQRFREEVRSATQEMRPLMTDLPLCHADGTTRWVTMYGRPVVEGSADHPLIEGVMLDATDRIRATEAARELETRLASVVKHVPGAVFRAEARPPFRDSFVSAAIAQLTGYPEQDFANGLCRQDLVRSEYTAVVDDTRRSALDTRNEYRVEYEITHRDGSARWVEERGQLSAMADGSQFIDGTLFDVTDRKALEHELAHGATHDPLTDLPNRTMLLNHIGRSIRELTRDGPGTSVLYIDLDNFKLINDSLGHATGDRVLQEVAHRLQRAVRGGDLAARTGGDEFILVCSGLDADEDLAIASRLSELLAHPICLDGRSLYVTASIGIARMERGTTAAEALRDADTAAYRAKRMGRDRHCLYDAEMRAATEYALSMETALHQAFSAHEFLLYLQPIVGIETGEIVGAEALVRWDHPTMGLLGPDQFLPHVDSAGLMMRLGREVADLAAQILAQVPETRLPRLAVNISPREVADDEFVARFTAPFLEQGVQLPRLAIEITEDAALADLDATVRSLHRLRTLGVRVYLDDFGTGYSSLSHLRQLPADGVKLDRSFIASLQSEERDSAIVQGITSVAHALGLGVTAEGIEDIQHLNQLRALGCDDGQGYLFSRPVPVDDFLALPTRFHHSVHDPNLRAVNFGA